MAVPPLVAFKAAQTAQGGLQKALTGDIYSCKWVTIAGKGKKAKIVEHEAHLNPVGLGLGAVAMGGAALLGLAALWAAQLKLSPTLVNTYKTVVDTPVQHIPARGHWEDTGTGINKGPLGWSAGARVWVVDEPAYDIPAVTHQEETGKAVKKFSIEQREGVNFSGIFNPSEIVGKGYQKTVDELVPTYLRWAAPWTWGSKEKWF